MLCVLVVFAIAQNFCQRAVETTNAHLVFGGLPAEGLGCVGCGLAADCFCARVVRRDAGHSGCRRQAREHVLWPWAGRRDAEGRARLQKDVGDTGLEERCGDFGRRGGLRTSNGRCVLCAGGLEEPVAREDAQGRFGDECRRGRLGNLQNRVLLAGLRRQLPAVGAKRARELDVEGFVFDTLDRQKRRGFGLRKLNRELLFRGRKNECDALFRVGVAGSNGEPAEHDEGIAGAVRDDEGFGRASAGTSDKGGRQNGPSSRAEPAGPSYK